MTDDLSTSYPPLTSPQRQWPAALAGVAALALGLGVAELVAGLLGRTATPVVAVGEAFIDLVPGWLKDLAVEWFGTADKIVLLIGIGVVLVAAGAGIGLLTARHRDAGLLAATALLGVAAVAVWSRPDTNAADLIPTIAAGVVALPALTWLVGRAGQAGTAPAVTGTAPA
ncbi:MAG TPA: hypothetical protein VFQ15_02360, partial [Jiangellaceae bacterium]|nr:hypothetical protein [Jiangellaceae bacterium]